MQLLDHLAFGMFLRSAIHELFGIEACVLKEQNLPLRKQFYSIPRTGAEYFILICHFPT
jgi:hypothetical protein